MIRFILIIFLFVFHCASAFADSITYETAVKDALKNSAKVKMKAEEIGIAHAYFKENQGGLYPQISANTRMEKYQNLYNTENITISGEVVAGEQTAWRNSAYLSGQYYLSNWYKKRLEVNYYEKLRDVRTYDCISEEKKLIQELTDIYNSLAQENLKLKYGLEILARLKDIHFLKQKGFEGGIFPYEDVLKAEAEWVGMDRELAGVEKAFRENLEKLKAYTGVAYDSRADVKTIIADGNLVISEKSPIEKTPEYIARFKELDALKSKQKAAANNYLPDIQLYGRYELFGQDTDHFDRAVKDVRQTDYVAGIFLTLPLFDGGTKKWERARSRLELKRQEENLKAVAQDKGKDIAALNTGYAELKKALTHYRKLQEQSARMLEITKKAHTLGDRSLIDIATMEKEALGIDRDLKLAELSTAIYEKRILLETDYENFMKDYNGNRTCKY